MKQQRNTQMSDYSDHSEVYRQLLLASHVLVWARWAQDGSLLLAAASEMLLALVQLAGALVARQRAVWHELGALEKDVARQTLAKLLGTVQWALLAQTAAAAVCIAQIRDTGQGETLSGPPPLHLGQGVLGNEFPLWTHPGTARAAHAALDTLLTLLQLAALHARLAAAPPALLPELIAANPHLLAPLQGPLTSPSPSSPPSSPSSSPPAANIAPYGAISA